MFLILMMDGWMDGWMPFRWWERERDREWGNIEEDRKINRKFGSETQYINNKFSAYEQGLTIGKTSEEIDKSFCYFPPPVFKSYKLQVSDKLCLYSD